MNTATNTGNALSLDISIDASAHTAARSNAAQRSVIGLCTILMLAAGGSAMANDRTTYIKHENGSYTRVQTTNGTTRVDHSNGGGSRQAGGDRHQERVVDFTKNGQGTVVKDLKR